MKAIQLAAAILFSLTLTVNAQTAEPATSLTANPVYQKNCAKCHGKAAEGRHFAGPSLVSDKTTIQSADDLRTIITNGKHRMPKFSNKLSSADVDALVDQIKSQDKHP